ncbi:MAG: Hint domain-containing protein [Proteobacteria bacterium]|nr:Hint domain-containing protein [Pseudomonadota bacterium]
MPTTYTWIAPSGDWFTGANWQPGGPPELDSVALINTLGGPTIAAGVVDAVQILAEPGAAALTLNGGTIGAGTSLVAGQLDLVLNVETASIFNGGFSFEPTATFGQLTIATASGAPLRLGASATMTAAFGHSIVLDSGTIVNPGTIMNDGTLEAIGGVLSVITGGIDGVGTILISNGGLVYSNETIGPNETLVFLDQSGGLQLYESNAVVAGPIVNFQAGNQIWLPQHQADGVSYDAATHTLTVTDAGAPVASFNLTTTGAPITFTLRQGPFGPVVVSSDATYVWNGGTADWYSAANWIPAAGAPPGFPLAGDTVQISNGLATISAADVAQYGTIDSETIMLTGTTGAPGGLSIENDTIGQNATIAISGTKQYGFLGVRGSDVLEGQLEATARNGQLTIGFADNARLRASSSSTLLSGTSAGVVLTGTGTFINDGIVVVQGALTIGDNVTFTSALNNSYGTVRLQQGGQATIYGTFQSNGVLFADSSGLLTIENLNGFQGSIWNMNGGNRIDLPNLTVTSVSYDPIADTLTLFDNATTLGSLSVFTSDGYSGFSVGTDGHGGSLITYQPSVALLQPALPVPFVAAPGGSGSLQDLLVQAFGTIPAQYTTETLGLSYATRHDLKTWNFSYWNLSSETVSKWLVNGTTVGAIPSNAYSPPNPPIAPVLGVDLAQVTLQAGSQIMPNLYLQIPIGSVTNAAYSIETVDPAVASPTIYSGHVDPGDILQSATRFATYYVDVLNDNDCGWIADDVAAAAGATMPNLDQSTDPTANQEGGFWRIAYRGSQQANPVQNWSSLVLPGDVVRMGWNGGGQHTTTVLGHNGDGSIQVYDNVDNGAIGIHPATYWTDTIPESITIYRLDANHQFLVQGSGNSEFLQGSPYSNLIQPGGGADTIAAGAGLNEVQDTAANLNGISIIDWHPGDTIDITDMPFTGARLSYNADSGLLQVLNTQTSQEVSVALPVGMPDLFQLTAAGNGTEVTVACFADRTRLRTPSGEVAVEDLRVGDTLVTVSDPRHPWRIVRWIGRRAIDLRRHRQPDKVRPVRVAAHAFGRGLPARPLLLSPDHAVYCGEVLIPVRYLINGDAIRQLAPRRITYWHVELDQHDAILAEGLPVESFLDTGQRHAFETGGGAIMLDPDFSPRTWEAYGFAPLVVTGPAVARARAALRQGPAHGSRRRARGA